jgi:hypothetical protein
MKPDMNYPLSKKICGPGEMSWTKVVKTDLGTLVKPFAGIEKVLNSFMAMEKDFIRPKSPNFPTVQSRRITYDR